MGNVSVQTLMNKILRTFFVLIALCSTSFASNDLEHGMLSLSPQFCITTPAEQRCRVTVNITWQLSTPRLVCLSTNSGAPLNWCTSAADVQSYTMDISTKRDIEFILFDKETQRALATNTLKITSIADTKTRRRHQTLWSLF